MTRPDPFTLPAWQALARESKLARHLLGTGATAIGTANYADRKGDYYVAFFGLSIGIERLAKLILVADYAIANNGTLPEQRLVSKFGHKLTDLLGAVGDVERQYGLRADFERPAGSVETAIIECLDSFADARRGRYANFDALGDPNLESEFEPIRLWWANVVEPILAVHFYGRAVESRVRGRAQLIDAIIGEHSMVRHTAEDGTLLQDVESSSYRTGVTFYAQKYGRYYTLRVVRWLSSVFSALTHHGAYAKGIDALFGHEEHFQTFTVEDGFLKTRKRWPL